MPWRGHEARIIHPEHSKALGHPQPTYVALILWTLGALLPATAYAGPVPLAIAGGQGHTCLITSSHGVKCMGANDHGQLGDGTTTPRYTPVDVTGLSSGVVAVATGDEHTCAVTDAGSVKCWGANGNGQLGDGTHTDQSTPTLAIFADCVGVAAGADHSCAMDVSGKVYCWGSNGYGQLGDGTGVSHNTATQVSGLTGAAKLVAGEEHTCAATAGGVMCWGKNTSGQLGDGTKTSRLAPVSVGGLSGGPVAISARGNHTCALMPGGSAKCWGSNTIRQLGDGTTTDRTSPVNVVGLTAGVVAISAGYSHTCALMASGSVKCWGSNYYGQVGAALPPSAVGAPTDVSSLAGIVRLGSGWNHSCAITAGGGVKCWGSNSEGQLGDGTIPDRPTPIDTFPPGSGIAAAASAHVHTCAVTTGGGAKCWGANSSAQLGDGTTDLRAAPVDVNGLGSGVAAVAAGYTHSCALTTGGGVKCWGENYYGQLGDGSNTARRSPVQVSGLESGVAAVAAGGGYTCALTTQGGMKCWGRNEQGQLGDDTTTNRNVPVGVSGLASGVVALAAGQGHTCAVLDGGALKCWGDNFEGQLGDGTTTNRSTPTAVTDLASGVAKVAAGSYHTCAVMSTGGVKCWGSGVNGRLGNGSAWDQLSPVSVTGLTNAAAVAAGYGHTCAVTTAGGVKCWGWNADGQLGNGSWTDSTTPVAVSGLASGATGVTVGHSHSCAVTSAGGVKCWGDNQSFQLGDGSWTIRTTPVVVSGYEYPSITAMAPVSALAGSGAFTITVYGVDFMANARVLFGGVERPTTWISGAELLASVPAAAVTTAGGRAVTVLNPSFGKSSNAAMFRVRSNGSPDGKDFNNDGQSDILWESTDGWVAAWLMNGTTQVENLLLYNYPVAVNGWHIAGTGDFNGDGQSDILWQSDSGYVAAWFMNGTTQTSNQLLYDYPVAVGGWHIAAAGDLDGDSISDILWQDNQGYVAYWLMGVDLNGRVFQRANALLHPQPVAAGGWLVVGTGDLNGDGMTDLVWQSPDGYVAAWIMNGVTQVSNTLLYNYPVATDGWTVVGDADMNGDGMVDILWQQRPLSPSDTTRGYVATWLMNGISHSSTVLLTPPRVTDPAWKIVGPK